MKYSRFVFFLTINDVYIAVYHSLLIRTVFLTRLEKEKIDRFLNNSTTIDLDVETEKNINHLFSNYFIIESDKEDEEIKKQCIENICYSFIANTYIITTENCNFNCNYCFVSQAVMSNRAHKIMTKDVVDATIDLLQRTYENQKDKKIDNTITFYGGEPLLNYEMIEYFMQKVTRMKQTSYWPSNVKYSIITNGSLLNEEHINFLKNNNIGICISFDVDKDSETQRISKLGQTTSELIRKSIQLCKDEGVSFGLSVTVTESTIKNKESVIKDIIAIEPVTVGFNMLIPNKGVQVSKSYYEDATNFMIYGFEKLREVGIYEDRIMRKVDSFTNSKLYPYDCCACGGNQYVISPDGEIGICHGYLNDRSYFSANVFEEKFDFKNNPVFLYWKNRSPLFMQECQNCECLGICGGGCAYAAEYNKGSIFGLDERFCVHSKTILKWLLNSLYQKSISNKSVSQK